MQTRPGSLITAGLAAILLTLLPSMGLAAEAEDRFEVELEVGPGRAEDLALKVRYDVGDRWSVAGGYRTVEGGADVDEVYNFAWFNAAVFSASCRF